MEGKQNLPDNISSEYHVHSILNSYNKITHTVIYENNWSETSNTISAF